MSDQAVGYAADSGLLTVCKWYANPHTTVMTSALPVEPRMCLDCLKATDFENTIPMY